MTVHAIWIALAIAIATIGIMDEVDAQGTELGKNEYLKSCASCHGVTGKGDGPVVKSLIKPPPDLTKLSEANKGLFPFSRVFDVIDGKSTSSSMAQGTCPCGEVYMREWISGLPLNFSKDLAEAMVRMRMLMLIEYIASLQGK